MKKSSKLVLILILSTILLFCLGILYLEYANEDKVAILGYHSILPSKINNSGDNLVVDAEKFEKELKLLKKLGYHTMTLDEFYCWKNGECNKKGKSVLITFDDGYQNNYDYAFEILKKYDMNAVVFCVGAYMEANSDIHMNIETIEKAKEEYPNIEFASHSYDLHFHSDKTYEIVDNDAKKMNKLLETSYYAYPFGDYNEDYVKALKDNDYNMAFTFGPSKEHRKADLSDNNYKVPRLNISNDMSIIKFLLRLILPM